MKRTRGKNDVKGHRGDFPAVIGPVEKRPGMAESAYCILRNAIVKGRLRPGQRLIESTLSQKLKVSRVPVREAIKRLEQAGFVKRLPGGGVAVKAVSEEDIRDAFTILAVLEGCAATRVCRRMDAGLIAFLEANIEATSKALQQGNLNEAANLNSRFHAAVVSAAGSELLAALVKTLRDHTAGRPLPYPGPHAAHILKMRRAMVEAMRRGDEKDAEAIAKTCTPW
jgi:DNA-binding GntR family transcriptional regulator